MLIAGHMQGTVNLVAVAKQKGIKRIVLVSSIGVDDLFFPLNLFFGVCSASGSALPCTCLWYCIMLD